MINGVHTIHNVKDNTFWAYFVNFGIFCNIFLTQLFYKFFGTGKNTSFDNQTFKFLLHFKGNTKKPIRLTQNKCLMDFFAELFFAIKCCKTASSFTVQKIVLFRSPGRFQQ